MRQGFPKSHRLLKRQDFLEVYSTGTPYRNAGFHLFLKKREDTRPARLGITVRKTVGGAVVRNRLRRWTRETFRLNQENLATGADVVVNLHPSLAAKSRTEFDQLLQDIFRKARLLRQ